MATLESPSLGRLLQPQFPYVIPEYQRPFSWGEEQVVDFASDLFGVFEGIPSRGSRAVEPYFFGAVITLERRIGKSSDDRVYEVVDGQQRLTTFYLTVSQLRLAAERLATAAKAEKADRARKQALEDLKSMDRRLYVGEPKPTERPLRLTPAGVEETFYKKLMAHGDISVPLPKSDASSHHRLYTAVRVIRDELVAKGCRMAPRSDSRKHCFFSTALHFGT
jgi:hypothetical protein